MFAARRFDPESGNYYYRARIYSPELGRFLQTDPLGYVDGLNLYAYVGNNPASWTEPYGEEPVSLATLALLGLAGGAIGIATTEPGQDALEAFTEHLIHAVETFPENAANVYGQVKDFLLPPPGMESAEEMQALHEHFRQAAAMAKKDGEDASSVTPTDDDKSCDVDPGKKPPIDLPPYLPWTEEMEGLSPAPSSAVPDSYMNPEHSVDMEPARDLAGSTLNASGEVRNANYFWRELLKRFPEMFSERNRYIIEELELSPEVDPTWIKHNPTHQSFKGEVLHHHHIDHGRIAVPLPKTIHEQWTSILH